MSVVKINAISVPPQAHNELEKRFANRAHTVDGSPGFLGFQLLRPVKGEERYFVVTQWEDEESFAAWRDGPALAAHSGSARSRSRLGRTCSSSRSSWTCAPRPDGSHGRTSWPMSPGLTAISQRKPSGSAKYPV